MLSSKKTCTDFDEGGAQGLLMNHLSLGVGQDRTLHVVFDASDSMRKAEEEEGNFEEPKDLIDLTQLRAQFFPDLDALEGKVISQELSDFCFAKDPLATNETTFFQDNTMADDNGDDGIDAFAVMANAPAGDDTGGDNYGGGMGMMDQDDFGDSNSNKSVGPPGDGQGGGPFVPFNPCNALNQRDLMLTMNDKDRGGNANPAAKATKPHKEKKEPNQIDFLTPLDPNKSWKTVAEELFAPPGKGASINLAGMSATAKKCKTKDEKKRDNHCLPDDMHFSSRQLVTLFLKPKFSLKMRGQWVPAPTNAEGEVDENFWVQAAGRNDDDMDNNAAGDAIPFNTQFFHDNYDDGPGFDDAYNGNGGEGSGPVDPGEQDLLAIAQGQTQRVKPKAVRFSKWAKQVDVRKLKENIWKGLNIDELTPKKNAEDMDVDDDDDVPEPVKPTEARQFTSVISNLQRSYPRDKMEEISTSFCFICLLHLANEQGLKLKNNATSLLAGDSVDTKIGNIWDLKVYCDPEVSQTA
ncbi:condensin complex subunit 2-domain-containing protein [Rhodocollybia butyracea]|uniref:Condensin complex subunit 2 n=1 Tax=Rhodocollybia butyracea TaxID=206335 RepID=A0A9P5PJB6_9AGAR|nr:condensin complex subunit 2-domain-containing protein [Rhodocollybia butyracea]